MRLRLSLWYAALCALAVGAVALVGYAASVRENYQSVDRVLVATTGLVETGMRTFGQSAALGTDTAGPLRGGVVLVLRAYSPAGRLTYRSPSDPGLPQTRPDAPLRSPAPPAYQAVLPPLGPWRAGADLGGRRDAAFGTLLLDGERWRRYVVRVDRGGQLVGYVEALAPLGRLDEGARALGTLLLRLVLVAVLAVGVLGYLAAGAALRPVDRLTRAARAVAQSRDLARRVPETGARDELGRLATTFNAMLGSLEGAWRSQQRFVADASHELRAPLTVMRGNVELLRRHPGLGAGEREEMLADIDREATRLGRLVEDLLLLARSDAGVALHRRAVDLRAVARDALRDARRLSGEHTLLLDDGGGPATVLGNEGALKQLLLILLDNALKYSPPGRVRLILAGGPEVTVRVQDEGAGISPADLPHIYERFYRADPARTRGAGGAGLGLSIAQWIAGQLEGELRVEETGPGGTTFVLKLPAHDEGVGVEADGVDEGPPVEARRAVPQG